MSLGFRVSGVKGFGFRGLGVEGLGSSGTMEGGHRGRVCCLE